MSEEEDLFKEIIDEGVTENSVSGVTVKMKQAAVKMTPWKKFLAIIFFIGGGLAVIGGMMSLFSGYSGAAFQGFINLLTGGLYIYLGTLLLKSANSMGNFGKNGGIHHLEDSMTEQANFWKVSGVVTIVIIALSILAAIIVAAIIGSGGINSFNRF